jgi:hypothetical protein
VLILGHERPIDRSPIHDYIYGQQR